MFGDDNFRMADCRDLDNIIRLVNQLSPPKEDYCLNTREKVAQLTTVLSDPHHYLTVYEQNNSVVGTGSLLLRNTFSHGLRPMGYIDDVVVDEEFRNRGIGMKLVNGLYRLAGKMDCYKAVLNCSEENAPFYESCGFYRKGETQMRIDFNEDGTRKKD